MSQRCEGASAGRLLAAGAVAGAAGTMALNAVSYLDMALRGRGSSNVPADTASRIAGTVGVDFGAGATGNNRASAVGALLGSVVGVSVTVMYGVVRAMVSRDLPLLPAAAALGAAAMVASDLPAAATGATKPTTWGASGWASDAVPHLAYGLAAAATFDLVANRE